MLKLRVFYYISLLVDAAAAATAAKKAPATASQD
jgi:hypothetical protein